MPASVIDPATFEDEWFGQLSDREMVVWIGAFSRLRDDQGRFVENAALARSRLFPYRDVPVSDIEEAFDHFVADNRLCRYRSGKQTLLQIVTWWDHQKPQWAAPSKLPSPEGWTDRIRTRLSGTYHAVNWDSPGGFARTPQVKASGGRVKVKRSGERSPEPFGLAHEPEPEPLRAPEPKDQGPDQETPLPPEPVDNSADQARGCSIEQEEERPRTPGDAGADPPSATDAATCDDPAGSHPPTTSNDGTCNGEPCTSRLYSDAASAALRRAMLASLHPQQQKQVGKPGPLDDKLTLYAEHVCQACQVALAEYERPQRDALCERALVAAVESLKGSGDVSAVITSRLVKQPDLLILIGDRQLEELRRTKRDKRRQSEPVPIAATLPPIPRAEQEAS